MKSKFIVLTITLMLTLSACEITPTPGSSTGSGQAPEIEEPTPEVVESEPEEVAPETEEEPAETSEASTEAEEEELEEHCLDLLEPLDLADLPPEGKVVFTWTAHPDAESYSLNFVFPDGLELNFTTNETTLNRYMDGFSMHPAYTQSGEHQWNVSALNAAGEELCQSDFFTFTKPATGTSQKNNDSGGGDSSSEECPPWGCGNPP